MVSDDIPAQNDLFQQHVIERAVLSVRQAQDWVLHFAARNDVPNTQQWANILRHRLATVTNLTQREFQDREYRIRHDY